MAVQLGVWDYVIFSVTIAVTVVIGGYRIFKDQVKNTTLEHLLLAKRAFGVIPIALSSTATLFSAVGLLTLPVEGYLAGISNFNYHMSGVPASLFAAYVLLAVYYKLNVTTVMEYMELRYNRALRIIAAGCYFIAQVMTNAVILHVTSQVIRQVTGIGIWESMAPIAVICTLYTALGGFKTVIWTDVFQAMLIFSTTMVVAAIGLYRIGGVGVLWNRLYDGDRTIIHVVPKPTARYTVWTNYVGGCMIHLVFGMADQTMIQRQMSLKSLKAAKMSILASTIGILLCSQLFLLFGLIIYANYFDCDPMLSGEIEAMDQLAPYFVMQVLENLPGLGGFYIAGIVAATLSTLSSTINSLTLIAIQDFVKPFYPSIDDKSAAKLSKVLAGVIGMASMAFVLVFENFSSTIVAVHAAKGITSGSLLGLTVLGMLVPFASSLGAAIGCVTGSALVLWIIVGASTYNYIQPYAPLTTAGCNETLGLNSTFSPTPYVEHNSSIFPLYTISFELFAFVGFIATFLIGIIASLVTGPQKRDSLKRDVIHPGIDKLFNSLPNSLKSKFGYSISRDDRVVPAEEEMMNISEK